MPRTKQRTPELKDRVLSTALAALESDGVQGFTTRRIATDARTSTPAVYELFGDRAGLVRAMFFEGFRRLARILQAVERTGDAVTDLSASIAAYRSFVLKHRALAEVMFSRPFADFEPGPAELAAGEDVRRNILGHVTRCIEDGVIAGDANDISHVLFALAAGLAAHESAGVLGGSQASADRRWQLAVEAVLGGLAPEGS